MSSQDNSTTVSPISAKPFMVIDAETEISFAAFETREEAQARADHMTQYHRRSFVVRDNSQPEDPNPSAPAAILALPAPSESTIRAIATAARRERHIARERVLRRKRIAARIMRGNITQRYAISLHAIALPAWVGLPAAWDTSPRQFTATLSMQERIQDMAGLRTGNPNDAWRVLMDEYLAKQAAKQAEAPQPDPELEAARAEMREFQYRKAAMLTRIGKAREAQTGEVAA